MADEILDNLKYIAKLCKKGRISDIDKAIDFRLSNPFHIQWPETADLISDVYRQLRTDLPSRHFHLLNAAIISYILLKKGQISAEVIDWAGRHLEWKKILPDVTINQALKAIWRTVPVVSVAGHQARVTFYLIGAFTGSAGFNERICPDWFNDCLSSDSRAAIRDGFQAAHQAVDMNVGLYIFAVRRPVKDSIHGRSLALPVGIGARAAMTDSIIYKNTIATGDLVLENGKFHIGNVQQIKSKYGEANSSISRPLFLYPYLNRADLPGTLNAIPVHSFEEGWMWASLYEPGNIDRLRQLETALRSKHDFIRTCDSLMPEHLKWAKKQKPVQAYLGEILSNMDDTDLLDGLSRKLEDCTKHPKGKYNRLYNLTMLYDDPAQINSMVKQDPETALLYCSAHVTLANHSGDNISAEKWKKEGMLYQEEASKTERGQRIFENFINRALGVSDRHNRYDFQPDMPELYLSILKIKESINRERDHASDYALGSMYGTIAQNYAFCGPDYLGLTRQYVHLAKKAFGSGKLLKRHHDWDRQNSYLYFALLDGGPQHQDEAQKLLLTMLKKRSWEEVLKTVSLKDQEPFMIFALSRGLTDIPHIFPETAVDSFVKQLWDLFCTKEFRLIEDEPHNINPWQLWCHNLGRLMYSKGKLEQACQAWEKSVHLCLKGQETMKVMALLPLSCLQAAGRLEKKQEQMAQSVLDLIRSSETLNSKHFKDIVCHNDTGAGLELVHCHPARFFPFSYR